MTDGGDILPGHGYDKNCWIEKANTTIPQPTAVLQMMQEHSGKNLSV